MFLGKSVTFTRTGSQVTAGGGAKFGALHFQITGYTAVRVHGSGVDQTWELSDGYNLVSFANRTGAVTLTFTGTGSVDWSTLQVYENYIHLWDESTHDRPRQKVDRLGPAAQLYEPSKSEWLSIGFEWRRLGWDRVDALEEIFDSLTSAANDDPTMVLVPDGFESESFTVVWVSSFDFYQSLDFNFNGGASGAIEFWTL